MANGTFNLNLTNQAGEGRFVSLKHSLSFRLEPNRDYDSANKNSPFYRALARGVDGDYVSVGAAWNKTSQAGREYISVALDDPSFPEPLSFAAFAVGAPDAGVQSFELSWTRAR